MAVDPTGGEVTPAPVVPVEPGYTTTEFWIALVTSLISLLVLFNVIHVTTSQVQAVIGIVGLVAPNVIYIIGRSVRKVGT